MVATPILEIVTEAMACMATATTMATLTATAVTAMASITLVAPPMDLATLPTATVIDIIEEQAAVLTTPLFIKRYCEYGQYVK